MCSPLGLGTRDWDWARTGARAWAGAQWAKGNGLWLAHRDDAGDAVEVAVLADARGHRVEREQERLVLLDVLVPFLGRRVALGDLLEELAHRAKVDVREADVLLADPLHERLDAAVIRERRARAGVEDALDERLAVADDDDLIRERVGDLRLVAGREVLRVVAHRGAEVDDGDRRVAVLDVGHLDAGLAAAQ